MYSGYRSPPGLDWDTTTNTNDYEDDPNLETFNADKLSDDLTKYLDEMYPSYKHGNILIPMGEDFHYSDAFENFDSTDRFIKHYN